MQVPVPAGDKHGTLIEFPLVDRRNPRAANRFLGKVVSTMHKWPATFITNGTS